MPSTATSFNSLLNSIFKPIASFLRRLFGLEEKSAPAPPAEVVSTAAPAKSPGIICPECRKHFPVSMEMLLYQPSISCPYCNLELRINREESKQALDPLKTYFDKMEMAKEQAKESGAKL